MRLAADLGKRSKDEGGRATTPPRVGVVIAKEGVPVAQSYRGMTGDGDHAEFGALQQLGTNFDYTGAIIYTTLEPCSVRPTKTPCADHLVSVGIETVYIGIYDPNPAIYRIGWTRLAEAGVVLCDFPTELREEIRMDNAGFIDQYREAFGPSGRASFNYSRNNGDYTLWGDHARSISFKTHWSSAASQVIHAYDEKNYVALALGAAQFNDIDDPSALEFDSRVCTARRGQIVVFRNEIGLRW